MKNFRENFAIMMFTTSIVSLLIVMMITPVGGWCESNPHHMDYKNAFLITNIMTYASVILLIYKNRKSR
jgi:hypothetical protein